MAVVARWLRREAKSGLPVMSLLWLLRRIDAVAAAEAPRGRRGAASQRSMPVNHGAQRTIRTAGRQPYRPVGEAPCRLWHARGHKLNRLHRYGSCRGLGGCERLLYDVLKTGPAGGLRPPSGPATTRPSPGNRPHPAITARSDPTSSCVGEAATPAKQTTTSAQHLREATGGSSWWRLRSGVNGSGRGFRCDARRR